MEFDKRLDEFKSIFRRSALPDTVRQSYEQVLAFMDASNRTEALANFSSALASLIECKLDLFFPVPDTDEQILDPEELLKEQQFSDVQELLRNYRQIEGNVTEAILDHVPGEGDETLCIFPAPFHLTEEEEIDPGALGDVIERLMGSFSHPTLLVRDKPLMPPKLYENVVIIGSSLSNLLRLVRCTAGICPEETNIQVIAIADQRFVKSMKKLLEKTKDIETEKTGERLRSALVDELKRELRHLDERLQEEHAISLTPKVVEDSIDHAIADQTLFSESPSLLSVPLHYSGGGYDTAMVRPLFQQYTSTEILTI